jgi:hypothetical protein
MDVGAAEWAPAERKAWMWAYLAGLPVQLPLEEHGIGQCSHCDALRELVREVNELLAGYQTLYLSPN